MVDVKGAIRQAGVYELPAGSRVYDAIQKAGGLTDQANSQSVNLAQKIEDESVVYVAKNGRKLRLFCLQMLEQLRQRVSLRMVRSISIQLRRQTCRPFQELVKKEPKTSLLIGKKGKISNG